MSIVHIFNIARLHQDIASNDRVISERWIENLEANGHGLILRYYPGIHLEGLRKTMETSVRIAGLQAEILNGYLPNMKEC
jgi:hypothetical protein